MMNRPIYAVCQRRYFDTLAVTFSDGTVKFYNVITLGCEWLRMSNDAFYKRYGFNFNPHEIPGLYRHCQKLVFGS